MSSAPVSGYNRITDQLDLCNCLYHVKKYINSTNYLMVKAYYVKSLIS